MNRVKLLTIMVLLGLIPQYAFSDKLLLNYKENSFQKKKQHPAEQYLSSVKKDSQKRNSSNIKNKNYNKLLIILVGFQEELTDNPNTSGNGQFQLEAPDDYPIQLAKPPHNQEYFDKMAEAMQYYYGAASLGDFNLEWDIYPKDQPCYTLSQPMGYYNPPGATNEEFVSKMEEYFKESFETADAVSPEIVFSDYAHYMIIHAGSDWQHDVLSDTPSDIPSFFIRVGTGKEAIVDNGSHVIDYACNVPETITQDIREYNFDGNIQVSGYGALNGVMFHEFGHSLGLVDLYAVNSYYPMVGSFDIMDSGGSTEVGMPGPDGIKTYSIEGLIPALPGAYSRVLMFEDSFLQRGILKDIETLDNLKNINISCAESRFNDRSDPYIYKLKISPDEYILIENRNVDPDGDGGTAVFSALDNRIALYPTAYADDSNTPTLEYDYLLPSFISPQGEAVGGGLLVWKVNNDVLYNQGFIDAEGNTISNFDNNFINTDYDNRGVEIIEADGIPDIGNVYAYWWKGTAFEYYFKNMPIFEEINGNDFFAGWSDNIHNTELNATSTPPLMTSSGIAHSSGLYNISQSGNVMRFSYGSPLLTNTASITSERQIVAVSPIFKGATKLADLALIHNDDAELFYFNSNENDFDYFDTIPYNSSSDISSFNHVHQIDFDDDSNEELVFFTNSEMIVIRNNVSYTFNLPGSITARPVYFNDKFYISVNEGVLEIQFLTESNTINVTDLPYEARFIIASEDRLYFITNDDILVDYLANSSVELPEPIYSRPVVLTYEEEGSSSSNDYVLYYSVFKSLFYYTNNEFKQIYDYSENSLYNPEEISQLALDFDEQGPYVLFTAGNRVYANYLDGTFPLNFPRTFHNYDFSWQAEIMIFDNSYLNNDESAHYGKTIYLPVADNNYVGWDIARNEIDPSLVISDQSKSRIFSHATLSETDTLGYFYQLNCYDNSLVVQWKDKKIATSPVLWETFNHNITRNLKYIHKTNNNQVNNDKLRAFVFPNPVASNQATMRIYNINNSAKLKIYNIAGKLIKETLVESNNLDYVDTIIDFSKVTSGIYIGIVEENSTYKFKFAVTK